MSSPDRNCSRGIGLDRKPAARRGKRDKQSRVTTVPEEEKATTDKSAVSAAPRKPTSAVATSAATAKQSPTTSVAGIEQPTAATAAASTTTRNSRPLCRFFVLKGWCKFGDDCIYSHTLPEGGILEARRQIICPFFLKGNCRYGNMCEFRHDTQEDLQEKKCSPIQQQQEEHTCGICLEPLGQEHNRRFGLLEGCDHVYCLDCLRTWRKEGSREAQDRRVCPTCRTKSSYIIPSWKYCTGPEKEQVANGYKARLASLPCQRFNGSLGSCPFGSDCFYAHIRNGVNVKSQDKTMEELRRERQASRRRAHSLDDLELMHAFLMLLELTRDMDVEWDVSEPFGSDDDDYRYDNDRGDYDDDHDDDRETYW